MQAIKLLLLDTLSVIGATSSHACGTEIMHESIKEEPEWKI